MMKKKWMMPVLALLLCVSMVGVGYAAWIIIAPSEPVNADGQFQVYTVENNSVQMTATVAANDKITFGSPATPTFTGENPWLQLIGGANEDLSATLTVEITNWEQINQASRTETITLTISDFQILKDDVAQQLSNYSNYVTFPLAQTATIVIEDGVITSGSGNGINFDASTGKLTYTLNFGWGQMFNSVNPYDYFNTKTANVAVDNSHPLYNDVQGQTWMELAEASLDKVSELDAVQYALTVAADIEISESAN